MRILYIILSCDKYKDTRQKWQRETWLKNSMCWVYLHRMPEGIEDNYKNAPFKYIEFFKDGLLSLHLYDWLFFCDDDTFVYTDKLEKLLSPYPYEYMTGFIGGTFNIYSLPITWCSGGAGFALSRDVVIKIQRLLRTTKYIVTDETDISLAIWATMACPELTVIDNKRFSPFKPHESPADCISYHYCSEQDFIRLNK